ncbi:MAG TPA: NADH-quinone oxidoreductase subunit NuoE [Bacillota bacterium]|jgi:NADH:ubiquinone oxidoreductase subunit E|nr:NADH-quinone oxidoreductase subunit NuoE [Bacillota bacterium]HOL09574.1 NADH-quinone oxidoreductase subunit NuoE [Bacillota bacterium]HPO97265.1 NADH-quinone oxidoreductase subunit NuoE [Bacillota bacterium]
MAKAGVRAQTVSLKKIPAEKFTQLEQYIESLPSTKGALIDILYHAQEIFGFLPREVLLFIAQKLGISGAEVFGVVSFYSNFKLSPIGLHNISVCMGTACFVKGAPAILQRLHEILGIKEGETTADGLFSLRNLRCVGACSLAPVVMIDDKVYGRVTPEEIEKIIEEYRNKEVAKNDL